MNEHTSSLRTFGLLLPALLGLFLVGVPTSFLPSLTTLRLDTLGHSPTVVGVVSSAYFLGLALGAAFNDRIISRVGHIRAYSSFASLITITALIQGLGTDPWTWTVLRFLCGWATVGVFLVIESWLLLSSPPKIRGQILAVYMVALYGSGMLGQVQLGTIMDLGPSAPFLIAGVLASMSALPVVIIPRSTPSVDRHEALSPLRAYRIAPTGVIGCFGSGVAIAAVYALLPLYLQRSGHSPENVGHLMACTILGAMLLQYPVGRWSDRQDRRMVLVILSAALAILSLCFIALNLSYAAMASLLFLLGGVVFTIYPVSVSLAADRSGTAALIPMIQSLLLINSAGSALSPLAIAAVMTRAGEDGIFWSFGFIGLALLLFFAWRRGKRAAPSETAPFAAAPPFSPTGAELRATSDLVAPDPVPQARHDP